MTTQEQAGFEEKEIDFAGIKASYVHNIETDIYVLVIHSDYDIITNQAKIVREMSINYGKPIHFLFGNIHITVDMNTDPATVECKDEYIKSMVEQEVLRPQES
ncbi:MAG: hypothetical protein ACMG57_02750 [Candidatus Dojkabacteria bacterium]